MHMIMSSTDRKLRNQGKNNSLAIRQHYKFKLTIRHLNIFKLCYYCKVNLHQPTASRVNDEMML